MSLPSLNKVITYLLTYLTAEEVRLIEIVTVCPYQASKGPNLYTYESTCIYLPFDKIPVYVQNN